METARPAAAVPGENTPAAEPAALAWQSYQHALEALYEPGAGPRAAERGGSPLSPEWRPRSAELLSRSSELRDSLQQGLAAQHAPQRELAGLKLLASAAYDLSVAGDLLTQGTGAAHGGVERAARGTVLGARELHEIMGAPLANGMTGLIKAERAAVPNDPVAARAQLEKRVAGMLQDIPVSAAKLSLAALLGMVSLEVAPEQVLGSAAAQELLRHIPAGVSDAVGQGAGFAVEAVSKLWAALNPEQQKELAKQTSEWVRELRANSNVAARFLSNIYETKRIGDEALKLISGSAASATVEQYGQALQGLDTLGATYEKTKGTIEWVIRVSAFAKLALLGAPPFGPLAAYSMYIALLGYTICSGGDYLDWYRMDVPWLARVRGLRTCVRGALSAD